MVLNRMNELIESPTTGSNSHNQGDQGSNEQLDNKANAGADEENNVSIVSAIKQNY